jgi:hypothetical protein
MVLCVVMVDTFRRQPDVLLTSDDLVTIPYTATECHISSILSGSLYLVRVALKRLWT